MLREAGPCEAFKLEEEIDEKEFSKTSRIKWSTG